MDIVGRYMSEGIIVRRARMCVHTLEPAKEISAYSSTAFGTSTKQHPDLYINLVEPYLSGVDRFTYDDLRRLAENGFLFFQWQEQQWRLLNLPEARKP
jgi:hypothetical protein